MRETPQRWFFGKDSDGHDYLIPVELLDEWRGFTESDIDPDDYEKQEDFEDAFGDYMIDGGTYTFTDPRMSA